MILIKNIFIKKVIIFLIRKKVLKYLTRFIFFTKFYFSDDSMKI